MNENTPGGKALLEAFNAAPSFVQEFIRSGEFLAFSERLEAKLAVDDATKAKVSNELLMTVLGITMPSELPDNLMNVAGLPQELVTTVIEEAREGMFEPLIARGGGAPAQDLPMVVEQPVAPPPRPTPPPRPAPPPPSRPQMPPPRIEVTPQPSPEPSVYETFHARTMASDIEAMQPGKQPPTKPSLPSRPQMPPSVPRPMPSSAPAAPPPPPSATPAPKDIHADLKKYGVDPYREPVE